MPLKLNSTSGGSVTLQEPTTASNRTITLPDGTGTIAVQGVSSNIVSGTAVASTSGTSIDFTGIPSWVKRITVIFYGVSTNGASLVQVQVGAGSVVTTGYVGASALITATSVNSATATTGFALYNLNVATDVRSGHLILTPVSGNNWACSFTIGNGANGTTDAVCWGGGTIALSGTLDRIRITTVNGTDTFDAGSINILYE
jgi:hypothetical protein